MERARADRVRMQSERRRRERREHEGREDGPDSTTNAAAAREHGAAIPHAIRAFVPDTGGPDALQCRLGLLA